MDAATVEGLLRAKGGRPRFHPGFVEEGHEDIYRGDPLLSLQSSKPQATSVSSSSSSGRSGLELRRGALGAILELAINRWGRATSDASSSSSTSSSTHTQRRRRRRSRNATSPNARSESIIRARRKARDEGRILSREFVLFLPNALIPPGPQVASNGAPTTSGSAQRRIVRDTSLSPVLAQLDSAIKRSAQLRKPKQPQNVLQSWFNDYMLLSIPSSSSQDETQTNNKDKSREATRISRTPGTKVRVSPEQPQTQHPWWLDVSNPSWSDLREIGKILHLHPLTLEDILHQESREKLELFPRLGYYFIVFRALESERTRSKAQIRPDATALNNTVPFKDATILGTNVYIVVFRDGICSFHFEDIADHIERVRNKIMHLEETVHTSSAWIAHGLLDSIVDDFFPLLNTIEQEIKDFDNLLLMVDSQPTKQSLSKSQEQSLDLISAASGMTLELVVVKDKEKIHMNPSTSDVPVSKKLFDALSWFQNHIRVIQAVFLALDARRWMYSGRRLPTPSPLIRMTSTRRLVTSLTRLLGTKFEVISQIRKRLTNGTSMVPKGPLEQALAMEVGIHFGDVQDHILTLQQSLAHYERMLSHSHPVYLSHLRVSLSKTKGDMDEALLILSVISVTIVTMQLVTGVFSVNVGKVPQNRRPVFGGPVLPPSPFNAFGAVLAALILVGVGIVYLARYWWLSAKRKYSRRSRL